MGADVDHGKIAASGGGDQGFPDVFRVVEWTRVVDPELGDQVLAQAGLGHLLVILHPPKTSEEHLESLSDAR